MHAIAHSEAGAAAMPPKLTQRAQIIAALQDGPGTAWEIAAELEVSGDQVTASIAGMLKQGRVTRERFNVTAEKSVWIYTVANGGMGNG